jgi:hypothetical protein
MTLRQATSLLPVRIALPVSMLPWSMRLQLGIIFSLA